MTFIHPRHRLSGAWTAIACGGVFLGGPQLAAQVFTANAGVASPELPSVRFLSSYRETDNVRDLGSLLQYTYSPTSSLEARLSLPFISRDLEFQDPAGVRHRDVLFGPGDLELRLKQSLLQDDDVLESTRWALMATGTAPTGDHDARDDGVEIPRQLQLGTGGWGLGAGTAFTLIRDRHRFSTEIFYRHRTRHDGFRLGDSVHLNLAYWYRLSPAVFASGQDQVELRGVFELLSSHRSDSRSSAGSPDDGGYLILACPGIQAYPSRDVLIEAALQVPIFQDMDDAFGDRQWGAFIGVKLIF